MTTTPHHRTRAPGFTLPEALLLPLALLVLLAVGLPVIARGGSDADVFVSLNNLMAIGAAHATYADDWNGRQITHIVSDISSYGDDANSALNTYGDVTGGWHPSLFLGWGWSQDGLQFGLWRYPMTPDFGGNYGFIQPIVFGGGLEYLGSFRMHHARPLHQYLSGRYYDPVFYPPADRAPYDILRSAFDEPGEFTMQVDLHTDLGDITAWSGYCPSPVALFHPDVMRHPADGGWQDPWSIDHGFETPPLNAALYPDLKTMMLEHHWNQNQPFDPCNPAFVPGTFGGCEPYYFNHALASEPASLFYDMSVRLLPNTEVLAADQMIMDQTGFGLWSRDTPWGEDGYLSDIGYDPIQLSHHVLTTDGILGRDRVSGTDGGAYRPPADSARLDWAAHTAHTRRPAADRDHARRRRADGIHDRLFRARMSTEDDP